MSTAIKFHRVASLPATGVTGHIYYCTGDGIQYIYTGTAFEHYGRYISGTGITVTSANASGDATVALNVDGAKSALGLKSAAYTESTAYATADQGALADTAVQSVTTGDTNGTIKVDGDEVAVKGLDSAAYTKSSAYATAAQGTKADSAIQSVKVNNTALTPDANKAVSITAVNTIGGKSGAITLDGDNTASGTVNLAISDSGEISASINGLKSAAYTESSAYATSTQGGYANSAIQTVKLAGTEVTKTGNNGAKTVDITADALISALGLSSAMHFVGTSTSDPKGTSGATVSGHTTWAAGDVVLYGNKEYVLKSGTNSAANWVELGDEGSHALNTVTITGTGALGGGGSLAANRTITHNTVTKSDTAAAAAGSGTAIAHSGEFLAVTGVTYNDYGHVSGVATTRYKLPAAVTGFSITENLSDDNIVNLEELPAGKGNNTVNIKATHAKKGPATASDAGTNTVVKGATADVTVTAGNSNKEIKVPKVTVDEWGHVTELTEQTLKISVPAAAKDTTITLKKADSGLTGADADQTFTLNQASASTIDLTDNWVEF